MKSHRANRCYPDAFIVQDLNRCTEIQYTLLGHFFNGILVPQLWRDSLLHLTSSISVEIVYFSWDFSILLFNTSNILSFNTSNIPKSHLQFQQQVLFSRDCSTTFMLSLCMLSLWLESMYWNSVYTTLLGYHCEEIVYFSRDFSTTFIQYIKHTEVTSGSLLFMEIQYTLLLLGQPTAVKR